MRIGVLWKALVAFVCGVVSLVLAGLEWLLAWAGPVGLVRIWLLTRVRAMLAWLDQRTMDALEVGIANLDAQMETGDDVRPAGLADLSWDETVWASGGSGYPNRHVEFSQADVCGPAGPSGPLPRRPGAEYAAGVASNTTKAAP